MADNKLNEASWDLVNSYREATQRVSESIVAAQERNMLLAQSIFVNSMELFRSHAENTQALVQELEQHSQKQQDAFQRLVFASVDIYMDFLRAPLAYYRQMVDTAESVTQRGLRTTQKAAREAINKKNE